MSSWSDAPTRSRVLRGGVATAARSARLDSDLRTTPFAAAHVVDARLTDPHLQEVVAEAARVAVEQGRAEGRAAGYAEGLAHAAAEAAQAERTRAAEAQAVATAQRARVAEALGLLSTATAALQEREAVAVAEVEQTVADLALQLARAVLQRELAITQDPGREALVRALRLAPDGAPVVARLHPQDLGLLQDVEELSAGRDLQLVADPDVERGGCVVDTAGRRIDTQVSVALERIAQVLR
jgi:flagellar assembly protein FliH